MPEHPPHLNAAPERPNTLVIFTNDQGEIRSLATAMPEKIGEMTVLLEKVISDGHAAIPAWLVVPTPRVIVQTEAALSFLDRRAAKPAWFDSLPAPLWGVEKAPAKPKGKQKGAAK